MVDRKPTYKNRVLVTKEADGTQEYVTWEHADSPITDGTPLNKQNLLSDEAAAAVGLAADATPSKAFEVIGASLGNLAADVGNLKSVTVSLPASGWSGSAPYTQTVSVSGMTADWVPGGALCKPVVNGDGSLNVAESMAVLEQMSYVKFLETGNGTVKAYCPYVKPTRNIQLRLPGTVEKG